MIWIFGFIIAVGASIVLAAGFIALAGSVVAARHRFFWNIWGNNQDQDPPDWYRPGEGFKFRTFMWYLRNPLHGLFWEIMHVSGERRGAFPDQVWNPNGGWNYATVSGIPAFVSYRGSSVEWYFGFREKGNFGIAIRKAHAK